MMSINSKLLVKTIAKNNGVSEEIVLTEIRSVIKEGMSNTNSEIHKTWMQIPRQGETPTPEEVIEFLSIKFRSIIL